MNRWTLLFSLVLLGAAETVAEARIERVFLTEDLGEVLIPVKAGDVIEFHLPEEVTHWAMAHRKHYAPKLVGNGYILSIEPSPYAPPTTLHIKTGNFRMTARVIRQSAGGEPVTRVDCLDPMRNIATPRSAEEVEGAWVSKVSTIEIFKPVTWRGAGYELQTNPGVVQDSGRVVLIPVTVQNIGDVPFPAADIQFGDHQGRPIKGQIVFQEGFEGAERVIPANGSALVTFRAVQPTQIAKGWSLAMLPAEFRWSRNRTTAVEPERGPFEGKLALSARYFGGVANLSDGLTPAATDWTSLQGIGIRLLYGLTRHVSLEGSLDFAWTGVAQVGASGDMRERSGRLQAAGLFHTGERWIPFGRLGLGARLSQVTTTTMGSDESEIVAGLVLSFGGGIAWRVNDRLLAGFSVAYNSPISGPETSGWAEVDLSLGWSWGPKAAR